MGVSEAFAAFFADAEPRLRRALIARFGVQQGNEATLDAMIYGWRHWDRVQAMDNPVGYLYRVGTSSVRPNRPRVLAEANSVPTDPWVEPHLEPSLETLSHSQRVAVVLHHSFEWTYEEIGDVMGISASTVRNHIARGMKKLRTQLEVTVDG